MKVTRTVAIGTASLTILSLIILLNISSFSNVESFIVHQWMDSQLTQTEFASSQMESHISQVRDELVTLSKFPTIDSLDINKCSGNMSIVHEKIEGKIDSLLRVDKDGNVIECSTARFSNYLGLNVANKDYFMQPKLTKEPYVSNPIHEGSSLQIIVSAPLFETTEYTPYPNFVDDFRGVLLSIVEVNSLYYDYVYPVLKQDKNLFMLVSTVDNTVLVKSSSLPDYSASDISSLLSDSEVIKNVQNLGDTIVTSSDLKFGSDALKLLVLTPLNNVKNDLAIVRDRQLLTLFLILVITMAILGLLISFYRSKQSAETKLSEANVTLKNLGIKIGVERNKYSQTDIVLDKPGAYLVKDDDENQAHELFISTLNKGYAGLGVTRSDPREVAKKYNLKKTSFIWLNSQKVEGVPCESNIDNLYKLVSEFVKKSKKSVILIDRVDYLLSENSSEKVIKRFRALKDLTSSKNAIIIISANPSIVKPEDLKALESESIDLFGKHLRKNVELSQVELEILKYVNDGNVTNKLVSYKNITSDFKITKPTTRSKIDRLQKLGLLIVDKRGRVKSIKITSTGRRLIG